MKIRHRIPTREALTQLLNTEPNETQFNVILDQLDDFIAAQLAGEVDEARFPGVAAYLDSDPRLAEIYDQLYRLEVDTHSDNLEVPASFPTPDLSFLPQLVQEPSAPVGKLVTQMSDAVLTWLQQLVPDKPLLIGSLELDRVVPKVALRGESDGYDNTPQQYIYYANTYCLFLNVTPGIVAQTPAQIDGNIMNQENPDENYVGAIYLLQEQAKLQETTLDEFGFFGLDGVEAGEYSLLLELQAHSIWIQGLVVV